MKKILKLKAILMVTGFSLLSILSGCNDANYSVIDNAVYLSEAEAGASKKITIDENGGLAPISVRIAEAVKSDVNVSLKVDPAVLDEYNKRNGTNYVTLPADFYSLSSSNATITQGKIGATPISLAIKPLSRELQESGSTYAIPVTIASVEGGVSPLESTKSFVYIIDQVIVTSVPVINSSNNLEMKMRQDYSLTQWSVEFCLNIDKLGLAVGQLNNQAMFRASANDSSDGEIYTRFGDAPIKGSIFQVKNQGTQFNSNTEFAANTWYHFAIVNDGVTLKFYVNGKLDVSMASPGKVTNLSKNSFKFGNTDYLKANVKVSELRFWTKAISQSQIQNNMYAINPKSDGLEAYWKLNEGNGNAFVDATGHGNNAVSLGTTNWVSNVRFGGN